MKRWIALLLLAASSANATTPADYAAVFPITTNGDQAAWLVDLDIDVYRWSQDENLRDMAIFNSAGNPVPLGEWNEITPTEVIEDRAPAPLLSLPRVVVLKRSTFWRSPSMDIRARQSEDQAIEVRSRKGYRPNREWLIDAENLTVAVDTIKFEWSSPKSGVVARFDIDGSSDLDTWWQIRRGATVLALEEGGARIDRREITLDRTGYAYLRLVRTDDGPDLIDLRVEISGRHVDVGEPAPLQWADAEYRSMVTDDTTHEVQLRYELPAALPLTQLRVGLSDDNALAHLQLLGGASGSDGSMRWNPRGQATAYRLRHGDELIENPEVQLSSGPRTRNLRLDTTTPLAQPPRISAGYRPMRIVFLAEGNGPYQLAVGSRVARHPDYPIATAINRLRDSPRWQPQAAQLGPMQKSAGEQAIAPPLPKVESPGWKRGLLWAVLILGAAVVGGLSLSLLRGGSQSRAEERQQPPEK